MRANSPSSAQGGGAGWALSAVPAVIGPVAFAAVALADAARWSSSAVGLTVEVLSFAVLRFARARFGGTAWWKWFLLALQWSCIASAAATSIRWGSLTVLLAHLGLLCAVAITNMLARGQQGEHRRAKRASIYLATLAGGFVFVATAAPIGASWVAFAAMFGVGTWWLLNRAWG